MNNAGGRLKQSRRAVADRPLACGTVGLLLVSRGPCHSNWRWRDADHMLTEKGFGFSAFVIETSGGMAQPHRPPQASRHAPRRQHWRQRSPLTTRPSLSIRRPPLPSVKWLHAISIARARTMTNRLRGAAADATANARVPRHSAAAFLSKRILSLRRWHV